MRTPGCVPEGQGRSSSSSTLMEWASSGLCEDACPPNQACSPSHGHSGDSPSLYKKPPRPGLDTVARAHPHPCSLSQKPLQLEPLSLLDSFHRALRYKKALYFRFCDVSHAEPLPR